MMYRRVLAISMVALISVVIPSYAGADTAGATGQQDPPNATRVGDRPLNRVNQLNNVRASRRLIRHKSRARRANINKGINLQLVPELDPGPAGSSLILLAGAILILLQRRRLSA